MVKFGEELETALFPLWKSYYIDYAMMKKAIKAVCAHYPYMDLLKKHGVHILNDPSRPFELVICGVVFTYHEDTSITGEGGTGGGGGGPVTHTNERMFVRVTEGSLPSTVAAEVAAGGAAPLMSIGGGTASALSSNTANNFNLGNPAALVGRGNVGVGLNSRSCNTRLGGAALLNPNANPDDDGWAPPVTHPHFIDSFTVPSAAIYEADPNTACPDDVHHPPAVGTYKLLAAVDAKSVMKLREGADFDGDNAVRRCLDFGSKGYIFSMVRAYRQAAREAEAHAKKGSATSHQMGGGHGGASEGLGKGILNNIGGSVMMVFDPSLWKANRVARAAAAAAEGGNAAAGGAASDNDEANLDAIDKKGSEGGGKGSSKKKKSKEEREEDEEGANRYFRIVATAAAEKPCLMSMRFYMCTSFPTSAQQHDGNDANGTNNSSNNNSNNSEIVIKHLLAYNNPTIGHAIYCYQHMVSNVLASVIKSEIEKVTNFYISQSHMACSSALLCVDGVKMWADLSAKERSQLRIAFRQTYSTLDMIQQFCDLNCVAVGKILKKMDKNTHQNMLEAYRHAIEEGGLKFKMGRNSRVAKLQHILADSYGRYALGKDHKKGLEFLDAREFVSRRDQQPTLLSLAALAGIAGTMVYFVVTTMWNMHHDKGHIFPPGSHADTYGAYLALIPLVVVSMTFLFSINVMVWEYFGINFAFMFELDPIFHWSGAELMRDSLMYILVWLACVYHFLLFNSRDEVVCVGADQRHDFQVTTTTTDAMGTILHTSTSVFSPMAAYAFAAASAAVFSAQDDDDLPPHLLGSGSNFTTTTTTTSGELGYEDHTSVYILYWVWPLWLCIFVCKAVFNKYAFNNRRPWIAIICKRIVTAPMTTVKFADFFIADQITSFTGIFFEAQFYWCVWFTPTTDKVCSAGRSMGLCILSILPNLWRLLQCFRRYHDQPKAVRKAFPNLVNAGKYGSSMLELIVWMVYNILKYTDAFGRHAQRPPTYVDSDYCERFLEGNGDDDDDDNYKNKIVTTIAGAVTTAFTAVTTAAPGGGKEPSQSPAIPPECIVPGETYWLSGDYSDELWVAFWIACGVSIFSQIYKYLWDIVVDAGIWIKVTPPPPAVPHWRLRDEKIYRDWWPYIAFVVEDFILRSAWAIKFWVAPWIGGHGWTFAFWSILEVFRRFVWNFFRVENEHVNNTEGYRATKLAPTPAKQIATWDTMADELTEKFMKDKDRTSAEFPTIKGINLTGITKFFARLPEEEKLNILLQGYSEVQLSAFGAPPAGGAAGFASSLAAAHSQQSVVIPPEASVNIGSSPPTSALSAAGPASSGVFNQQQQGSPATFEGTHGEGKSRFFSELPEEEKVILLLGYLKDETMNCYLRRIGVVCEEGHVIPTSPGAEGGNYGGGGDTPTDGSAPPPGAGRRATIVVSGPNGTLRGPNGAIIGGGAGASPASSPKSAAHQLQSPPTSGNTNTADGGAAPLPSSSPPSLVSPIAPVGRTVSGGLSPRLQLTGGQGQARARAVSLVPGGGMGPLPHQQQQQHATTDHIPRLPTTPRPGTYTAGASTLPPTRGRATSMVNPNTVGAAGFGGAMGANNGYGGGYNGGAMSLGAAGINVANAIGLPPPPPASGPASVCDALPPSMLAAVANMDMAAAAAPFAGASAPGSLLLAPAGYSANNNAAANNNNNGVVPLFEPPIIPATTGAEAAHTFLLSRPSPLSGGGVPPPFIGGGMVTSPTEMFVDEAAHRTAGNANTTNPHQQQQQQEQFSTGAAANNGGGASAEGAINSNRFPALAGGGFAMPAIPPLNFSDLNRGGGGDGDMSGSGSFAAEEMVPTNSNRPSGMADPFAATMASPHH